MKTALIIAMLWIAARTAHAQPVFDLVPHVEGAEQRAKDLYAHAARQYEIKQFHTAIYSFREAYDVFPEPLLLFDVGQSYRQLHECDHARSYYRYYLRVLPTADNRAQVERFIAEMDRCPVTSTVARDRGDDTITIHRPRLANASAKPTKAAGVPAYSRRR